MTTWLINAHMTVVMHIEDQLLGKEIGKVFIFLLMGHNSSVNHSNRATCCCFFSHVWIQSWVKKCSLDLGWQLSIYWLVETHITAALSCQQLVHHHPLPSAKLITPSCLSAHTDWLNSVGNTGWLTAYETHGLVTETLPVLRSLWARGCTRTK